jgi:hypothetical protein
MHKQTEDGMRGYERREKRLRAITIAGIMILSLITSVGSVQLAFADDTVSITCYTGYPPSNRYVGTVTIFDVSTASNACNAMYYDCRKKCIGCYIDRELVEDVCIDPFGNTFLK